MRAACLLALLLVLAPTARAADEAPRLHAGVLPAGLHVDGRLDEPAWAAADSIDGLTMLEPREGATPAARTVVRVLAGPRGLAVGVRCEDPEPRRIVSFTKERDGALESEDHVRLVLGPFRDGHSGYVFAVNPGGARYDALVSPGAEDELDAAWDGAWEAACRRDSAGWTAEMLLPAATLSFRRGLDAWHFNVERRIQRLQETDRWAGARRDWALTQTLHAGELGGLPVLETGAGLTARPALAGGARRDAPGEDVAREARASVDLWQRLGPDLTGSLTVNTDFAETEVDARQTNLTRFPLFFPEKRAFFLEGSDLFDFGLGLGTDVVPFHSRRIGLVEGQRVPLEVGAKLTGRAGRTRVGALVAGTGAEDGVAPAATMGVVRVRRDVLEESSVGVLATAGDPLGASGAWLAGADATWSTSRFRGGRNLALGVWGLGMGSADVARTPAAFGLDLRYPNDRWEGALDLKRIERDFQPALGFVPRPAVQQAVLDLGWMTRPESGAVRAVSLYSSSAVIADLSGRWESWFVYAQPLELQFESGERVELSVEPAGERLDEPFEIADGVVIAPGTRQWTRVGAEAGSAERRRLSVTLVGTTGGFYDGTLHHLEGYATWTPSPLVTLIGEGEHDIGHLPAGDFTETLVSGRVRLNLSPDLSLTSFVQWDATSRDVGTNTRLRWSFDPLGDLFLIYNHDLRDETGRLRFARAELIAKVQRAFRI